MSEPILWDPDNTVNKFMWQTMIDHPHEPNLELLEESVYQYIHAVCQSDNGTGSKSRKNKKKVPFETDLDAVIVTILLESAELVLSGKLDKLKESSDE